MSEFLLRKDALYFAHLIGGNYSKITNYLAQSREQTATQNEFPFNEQVLCEVMREKTNFINSTDDFCF